MLGLKIDVLWFDTNPHKKGKRVVSDMAFLPKERKVAIHNFAILLGLRIQRLGVRAPLGSPCCVLEQDIFCPKKVLVIPWKGWLHPNITEKLLTGTLSIKPNQKPFYCGIWLNKRMSTRYSVMCFCMKGDHT